MRLRASLPFLLAAFVACSSHDDDATADPAFEADWTEDFENDTEEAAAEEAEQEQLDQLDDLDDVETLDGEDAEQDSSEWENAQFDQTIFPDAAGYGDEGQPAGALDPNREDHFGPVDPGVDDDGNDLPAPEMLQLKGGGTSHQKHGAISIIEEDPWFSGQTWNASGGVDFDVDTATARVAEAKAIGAKVLRVMLWWSNTAPGKTSLTKPDGFVASQPGGYDWRALDAQVIAARRNGLKVLITVTAGPMPYWASEDPAECKRRIDAKQTWSCSYKPDPKEYAKFITAVGRHVKQRHFRIWAWTLVNEPNIGAFISDRDSSIDADKNSQMEVAFRYRRLWFAARKALHKTAGVRARVFFSDQANNQKDPGETLTPDSARWNLFNWSLCLQTEWNPDLLSGKYKCPLEKSARKAVCSGVAFHPYASTASQAMTSVNFLQKLVDDAADAGRISKGRGLYMTEGGFLTAASHGGAALGAGKVVTPDTQAKYIMEFDKAQWSNSRVKSVAQYELVDEGRGSWDCGLRYAYGAVHKTDGSAVVGNFLQIKVGTRIIVRTDDGMKVTVPWDQIAPAPWDAGTKWFQRSGAGAPKPAYAAYRMPVDATKSGDSVTIWGHARFDSGLGFTVEGKYPDGWHSIDNVNTDELGYGQKTFKTGTATGWRIRFGTDTSPVVH